MDNNKETGSYYTPYDLIQFMVKYLKKQKQDFSDVLEPSAGDGRFLSALSELCDKITAIELFQEKVDMIRCRYNQDFIHVEKHDFIQYARTSKDKYSLIIGNPPYINPKVLDKESLKLARDLCESEGLKASVMQNMWLAFVVGACKMLKPGGTIFFVLPMEFLQVQYAEKLREHLEKKFNTIHIISFNKSIFPDIEQETCLVYLTNKKEELPYILYEVYEDATTTEAISRNIIKKNKPLKKWSNAVLRDDDILLLQKLAKKYIPIKTMGETAPGIVTGGNQFFILTEEQVEEYECRDCVLPIVQKNSYISENTIVVDDSVFADIKKNKKPCYVLDLMKTEKEKISERLMKYLEWAGEQEVDGTALKERYKCANREPWYGVPIVNKGDVIFFKRYHILPRVYINRADVHTTDAGYHIRLDEKWDRESLVFCFYNSLTLAQCEFQGRYYGGGVRELVPSEFKEISVPYRCVEKEDVEKLNQMFINKKSVDEIVAFVNSKTLVHDMDETRIERIEGIRVQLLGTRQKGNRR